MWRLTSEVELNIYSHTHTHIHLCRPSFMCSSARASTSRRRALHRHKRTMTMAAATAACVYAFMSLFILVFLILLVLVSDTCVLAQLHPCVCMQHKYINVYVCSTSTSMCMYAAQVHQCVHEKYLSKIGQEKMYVYRYIQTCFIPDNDAHRNKLCIVYWVKVCWL